MILIYTTIANAKTLKWGASTGEADGYTDSGNKTTTATEIDIDTLNLLPGTYTFIVKAYNVMGESGPSNEAPYAMDAYTPPGDNVAPVTLTIPNAVGPVTIIIN